MKKIWNTRALSIFLLFFSIPFILTFFSCTTEEYDHNQKLDRGFVGRDAVYFSVRNATEASTPPEDYLTERLQKNVPAAFFLVSQKENIRGVYYQGDTELPPILEGRFFTSEESKSGANLAVIGKNKEEDTFSDPDTGKRCIYVNDVKCEVIGIMGLSTTSTIDELIYAPLGVISVENQLAGVFFVDGTSGVPRAVLRAITTWSDETTGLTVAEVDMPQTATDSIAGGIFMAEQLRVILFAFLTGISICFLVFFLLSIKKQIAVELLIGSSYLTMTRRLFMPCLLAGILGITLAFIATATLAIAGFFQIPTYQIFVLGLRNCALSLFFLFLWVIPLYIVIGRFKLQDSLR